MKRFRHLKTVICLGVAVCMMASSKDVANATRSISEIQADQDSLQDEIDALDADLYSLVLEVTELEEEISETQTEIEDTEAALEEAQAARDEQYESMKLRIQYMYEADDPSVFEMLMESGSISEFLNRLEYVSSVYDYDREKLEQFEATQAEIEELAEALDEQMEELESSKAELETQESALDAMIEEKEGEMDDLDAELKEAKEIAAREAAL